MENPNEHLGQPDIIACPALTHAEWAETNSVSYNSSSYSQLARPPSQWHTVINEEPEK